MNDIPNPLSPYLTGRIAIFIDTANILYSQKTLGWQLDYKKLIKVFQIHTMVFAGFYYGTIRENAGQDRFFAMLTDRGYTVRTKPVKYIQTPKGTILKGNLDTEIVYDMLTREATFDTCLLFSGDSDFEVIVSHLRKHGKTVIILSTKGHVALELIRAANKYIDLKKLKALLERTS